MPVACQSRGVTEPQRDGGPVRTLDRMRGRTFLFSVGHLSGRGRPLISHGLGRDSFPQWGKPYYCAAIPRFFVLSEAGRSRKILLNGTSDYKDSSTSPLRDFAQNDRGGGGPLLSADTPELSGLAVGRRPHKQSGGGRPDWNVSASFLCPPLGGIIAFG